VLAFPEVTRVQMPHGSVVEHDDEGRLRRWIAPAGTTIAEVTAEGVTLDLAGVHDRAITVGGPIEEHAVLGPVQLVRVGYERGETVVARVAATDWSIPARIPAIDAPARVPAGAGTVLLNVLALAAQAAGRTLRYAGPYPTAALWRSLQECFRPVTTGEDVDAATLEARFTEGQVERAFAGDVREVPVDFAPAPFERVQVAPRAVVHLRDGVERLYLGGLSWGRAGARRLVTEGDAVRAELWIGGSPWAEVAVLDLEGRLVTGPRALPSVRSAALGKAFPPALLEALGELIADDEPPLLASAMREVLREVQVVWGDPGADVARPIGGVLVVHAGLWERLGGGPPAALAAALASALTPPIKLLAQQKLETIPLGERVH
jgi:hypothetical protein